MVTPGHFVVLCGALLAVSLASKPFEGHKVIRVRPQDDDQLQVLRVLQQRDDITIDFWTSPRRVGLPVDMRLSKAVYNKVANILHDKRIEFTILIVDVQRAVDEAHTINKRSLPTFYTQYQPLDKIVRELKNLARQYPKMTKLVSAGKSYQERDQLALEITGKSSKKKPIFFINCGIHAREWIAPATCMYIIKQIVSQYGKDDGVTAMLDKMDFIIMPVLNVDGYEFTWGPTQKHRFWRKTLSPTKFAWCTGADPNRNWGYNWGYPGASDKPCSDEYRGKHAFSEIEVQNVADFLKSKDSDLAAYMDIHAYGQYWLIPWGYTKKPSPDHNDLMRVSQAGADAIKNAGFGTAFSVGPSSVIIYENSGGSKDYTYGALKVKYSFALELRDTGKHGFLLPPDQIIPTGRETFAGIRAAVAEMKV